MYVIIISLLIQIESCNSNVIAQSVAAYRTASSALRLRRQSSIFLQLPEIVYTSYLCCRLVGRPASDAAVNQIIPTNTNNVQRLEFNKALCENKSKADKAIPGIMTLCILLVHDDGPDERMSLMTFLREKCEWCDYAVEISSVERDATWAWKEVPRWHSPDVSSLRWLASWC